MRRSAVLFGALLLLAGPTGCADAADTYCGALEDEKRALDDLARSSNEPDDDLFVDGLAVFERLREESPDDIRDEWDTLVFAWEAVVDAFERAGTGPREYRPGGSTPGVTEEQERAIEDAAAALGSARVVDAGEGIEQHAKDVCRVDLGL